MIVPFRRSGSDEERVAKAAAKRAERDAKAREAAATADQATLQKEAEQREWQRQAFLVSPAGQARAAFERGARLFQFFMDVEDTEPVVIPMGWTITAPTTADPVAILNAVCNEGWELVNGSFVFHELGQESRNKPAVSGQNVAVRGAIVGYYLFRRSEQNKLWSRDPWDIPSVERVCAHCGSKIQAAAKVCPHCHYPSDPWHYKHDRWWRTVDSEWHFLDESGEWKKHSADGEAISETAEGT